MRCIVLFCFWQVTLVFVEAGCLGEPGSGVGRESCGAGTEGGTGPSTERERSLKPAASPLDGGCICPVEPGCGTGGPGGEDSPASLLDGGSAGNRPAILAAAGRGGGTDYGDDASSPAGNTAAAGDEETPGLAPPSSPGDLVITEIMADPSAVTDAAGEWLELYHPGSGDGFDLRGCELADGEGPEGAIENALAVSPGGFVVVARSADPGFAPDCVCPGLSLRNSGGDQVILRCNGVVIDSTAYTASQPGRSLSLDPSLADARANDDPSAWCPAAEAYNGDDRGTPGRANPPCEG